MSTEELGDMATTAPPVAGNGRVTYADMTAFMSRFERELRDGQARLEGKMDAFIATHQQTHNVEQAVLNDHLRKAAVMEEQHRTTNREVNDLNSNVGELMEWKAELRGMTRLVQFALGASLVGAMVSILTLINLIEHAL